MPNIDPQATPIEPPIDPAAFEPVRRADQIIYLKHPSLPLKITYWRGRVADMLIDRLGYTQISREEYLSDQL